MARSALSGIMRDMGRSLDARHARVKQTPEVLYKAWPRPLRIGQLRVGEVQITRHPGTGQSEPCYGTQGHYPEDFRVPTGTDQVSLDEAREVVRAAQRKLDGLRKRVWTRARPLTIEELLDMGAEDLRS